MTDVTLKLDPVALREATSQAIMGLLTPELRAEILQKAISSILAPGTNSWDRGVSPLQRAFNDAVDHVARECARTEVQNNPEIMEKIRGLVTKVAAKVIDTDPDKLVERMADAFVASMRRND